jgi:hypothetical protein
MLSQITRLMQQWFMRVFQLKPQAIAYPSASPATGGVVSHSATQNRNQILTTSTMAKPAATAAMNMISVRALAVSCIHFVIKMNKRLCPNL